MSRVKSQQWIEQFLASLPTTDECIDWPLGRNAKGYGRAFINGVETLAHRYICEQVHGPAPEDRPQASHDCGRARCVNPAHLRWASNTQNTLDKRLHAMGLAPTVVRRFHRGAA